MKKINYLLIIFVVVTLGTQGLLAQVYEVPPSAATSSSVPAISDKAMERCVILHNDAKRLKSEIDGMYVDNYSQISVNNYNRKVNRHSQMIRAFNNNCAGKQSESAKRAAEKLNQSNQ